MKRKKQIPRIMIAGTASGSGKTILTCGLLHILQKKGLCPVSYKCGPDYIDPLFHEEVLGIQSGNLDSYFCDADTLKERLAVNSSQAGISVIEGVMGFYDGVGLLETGSSAEIAGITKTPVILAVNCRGMSSSVGAVLKGFLEYRQENQIKGVIFNRLSARLYPGMAEIAEKLGIQALGYVPYHKDLILESRHLGLMLPDKKNQIGSRLKKIADYLEQTIDIEGIVALSKEAEDLTYKAPKGSTSISMTFEKKAVIGVARDEAFPFLYRDNMALLRELGCHIEYFSPIRDKKLPPGIQGLLLSGGYPELYGKELSENTTMRLEIKKAIASGMPCIAECGGFLYLHETLTEEGGGVYPMAGVIKGGCRKGIRLSRFGYIEVKAGRDTLLGKKNEILRAHEFHYYQSDDCGEDLQVKKPGSGEEWRTAWVSDTCYMGYPHFYLYGSKGMAERFVKAVKHYVPGKQ